MLPSPASASSGCAGAVDVLRRGVVISCPSCYTGPVVDQERLMQSVRSTSAAPAVCHHGRGDSLLQRKPGGRWFQTTTSAVWPDRSIGSRLGSPTATF